MKYSIEELKRDIEFDAHLNGHAFRFVSTWGLFSPTQIDEGTRLLLEHVEVRSTDVILDIGCGYGVPGIPLAFQAEKGNVHMVDKDFVAVEYAKKNARLNGAENCAVYLSNGLSAVPKDIQFDTVVSNLPAKSGRELFDILLHDANERLKPGGKMYVVTIAGLKDFIKRNFTEVFGNYRKLKQGRAYSVAVAQKKSQE